MKYFSRFNPVSVKFTLGAVFAASLVACGGSPTPAAIAPTTQGTVVNSYVYGAVVTLDANDDGVCGSTEPKVVSSMTGAFSFPGLGDHMVCSIGGYNTATNLPMVGELRAAAGSPVITPLTTLMVSQLPPHPTVAQIATAQAQIETQLSLPAGALSLDPVTAIGSNPKIEQTNAAVQTMLATASESVAAFAGIAKPTDASTATQKADYQSAVNLVFANAAKAVATSLAAAPAPVDLTDSTKSAATTTFVGNVVQSTITAVNTAAAATGGTNATATLLKAAAPNANPAATLASTSSGNAAAFVAASISASVQSVAQTKLSTDAAANKLAIGATETASQSNTSIVNLVSSVQNNAPTLFTAPTPATAEMAALSQVLLPSASVVANTAYTAPTSAVITALNDVAVAAKVTSITTASVTALQAAVVATPAAPTQVDLTKVVLPTTPALPPAQVLTGAGA